MIITILSISIVIQLITAGYALSFIRLTGARSSWMLIATALLLMAARRIMPLYEHITTDLPIDALNESIALFVSLLLLSGVHGIKAIFIKNKQLKDSLVEAKRLAEQSNEAKTHFFSKMSHEIRTPMNAIIGMTDLVLLTQLTALQRKYLEYIKSGSARLLSLVNEILDLSKIESHKMELMQIPFCLLDFLKEGAVACETLISGKSIVFESIVEDGLPEFLRGDPLRLHQILGNLLSNAAKFTESGKIALYVNMVDKTADGLVLKFSITDTGMGIPADKMDRLFQYFSQLSNPIDMINAGSGLGLAVSKELVEKMGGRIWVESEPGKGSTFHFTANLKVLSTQPEP